MLASLVTLLIVAIILSLVYWLLTVLPLPSPPKNIILTLYTVVCIILLIFWLLSFIGVLSPIHVVKVGQLMSAILPAA